MRWRVLEATRHLGWAGAGLLQFDFNVAIGQVRRVGIREGCGAIEQSVASDYIAV